MRSTEERLVEEMLGQSRASVLMTDGYKFSMAQAGFPLRTETFYLSFRRPGWHVIPFDLAAVVEQLRPATPSAAETDYLRRHGYGLTPDMATALGGAVRVWAAPKGSWVREREPILAITGPSFLVSWLESLVLWLHFPIQVATTALTDGRRAFACSCEAEARIARLALDAVHAVDLARITVDDAGYREGVRHNARELVAAVTGDAARLFEVGMRSASCMAMQRGALGEIATAGIARTSNVYLAEQLGLTPIGTTGHEHQQRWRTDLAAFRAIRDRRPGLPSYLFDTYDAFAIGIPSAVDALEERPDIAASVRFDSGDHEAQLAAFVAAGVAPTFVFMDSMNPERIARLERTAARLDVAPARRTYGAGGQLIGAPSPSGLSRDRVAAVYKLAETGGDPVMKFSVPGKSSVPGRPVVFRRVSGAGPVGVIGQANEPPPEHYLPLTSGSPPTTGDQTVALSSLTATHVRELARFHLGDARRYVREDPSSHHRPAERLL